MISKKKIVLLTFDPKATSRLTEFDVLKVLAKVQDVFEECYMLHTCQRLVFIAYAEHEIEVEFMADKVLPGIAYHTYSNTEDAANYMFRVACGLESKVLGEHEIVSQIKKWLHICYEHLTVGPVLGELIRQSLQCSKIVRSQTGIGSCNISYASLAFQLIEEKYKHLNHHYLVIGTGAIAKRVVQILAKRDVRKLTVASHDLTRAREFTEEFFGTPILIENIADVFNKANVIIGGTHGEVVFHKKYSVHEVCPRHHFQTDDFSKLIIDFGMPANFPSMKGKANYYGINQLTDLSVNNQQIRFNYMPEALRIIAYETARYLKVFNERKLGKLVGEYWQELQELQAGELEWLFPKLDSLNEKEKELIRKFSHRLIRRISKTPITSIRSMAGDLENNADRISALAFVLSQNSKKSLKAINRLNS